MVKIRKTMANVVAMFCPTRKMRRAVRKKIRGASAKHPVEQKQQAVQTQQPAPVAAPKPAPAPAETPQQMRERIKLDWRKNGPIGKLLPGRFEEYDVAFGIGSTCRTANALGVCGLRAFASPFDWASTIEPANFGRLPNVWRDTMFGVKVDAILNNFENWFNFEDMAVHANGNSDKGCLCMCNTANNMRYIHLFPENESWERYFPTARETIMKRADRLCRTIENSEKILVCWMHRVGDQKNMLDAPVPDAEIKNAVKKVNKKYPNKKFDFVFFEHDGTLGRYEYRQVDVCDGARRIFSNHYFRADETYCFSPVVHEALTNVHLVGC